MNWITESIGIGNYLDAESEELRTANDIRSMLCLNGKLRGVHPDSLLLDAIDNYDLKDGPGNSTEIFRRAVESLSRLERRHPKVLVFCHAGRSRSVVVVAAHLMRSKRLSVQDALKFVTARREAALTAGIETLLESAFLHQSKI